MNVPSALAVAALSFGGLLVLERVWRFIIINNFFRKPAPEPGDFKLVSMAQPICGGDPNLEAVLEKTLCAELGVDREIFWLLDPGDRHAREVCERLLARHPGRGATIVEIEPSPQAHSPKMTKVLAGLKRASGDVLCSIDDDIALDDGALASVVGYLNDDSAGLVHGLPYYTTFDGPWNALVGFYVNTISVPTFAACDAIWRDNIMQPGNFWVMRREVYDDAERLEGVLPYLADADSVPMLVRRTGRRVVVSRLKFAVATEVEGGRAYFRMMHRWFMYGRELLVPNLSLKQKLQFFVLGGLPIFAPYLFLALGALTPWAFVLGAAHLIMTYVHFAWLNAKHFESAAPWWRSGYVFAQAFLLPVHMFFAMVLPMRIEWRGNRIRIKAGGGFEFLERVR